jgi:RNA polymerase sigma-70 factor (ECF subfamily)
VDEADLIRRACQGDNAAWEALVDLHREAVFRLAYLLLGDPHDADDVAQEAFIRASPNRLSGLRRVLAIKATW